ncbi:P-loop containing nucleoside triphosphate hydrolase protein [Ephemerocybe angulata]|uniref:Gluconokinase n=1 Tax=Ephemerocybe angulata TaxID=980116 RepID=A0A8H6MG89_9AGAR|nr:P-loop containing nucleoside triphosphate hydrolase protein [Tulosesus angulatus]
MSSAPESQPQNASQPPVLIIVMGVCGTGKSTLGSALAASLGLPYLEGDDLHPQANIDKMSAGNPLNDADREPWLALIRRTALDIVAKQQREQSGEGSERAQKLKGVVASCSALKAYYRSILRGTHPTLSPSLSSSSSSLPTYFVFINGSREVLLDRMNARPGHFMKSTMLDSQLATLEDPRGEEGVVEVGVEMSTEEQVAEARRGLAALGVRL